MTAANTKECFTDQIGKRVIGVMFGVFPRTNREIASSTRTIVFDDGTGLTFSGRGSYWLESAQDVKDAALSQYKDMEKAYHDMVDVFDLTGLLSRSADGRYGNGR